jgi:nucleotide-binding universal stress UspA family protein
MFQRILVPLDGSQRAEQAIPLAGRIARASHGSVILLQVAPTPTDLYWLSVEATEGAPGIMQARRDEIKRYLAQLTASQALEGVGTITEVGEGTPAETILSIASSQKADLILMCSHGYTGFRRWVLGSVAHKVAWHSMVPVFILRENSQKLTGLSPNVGYPLRALVALDGTSFTEAAVLPAAQLVAACSAPAQGEIHLTHLVRHISAREEKAYEQFGLADLRQAALRQFEHYLQAIKERLSHEMPAETTVDITWSIGECIDVAESLLQVAEGEGVGTHTPSDLIALTTHGRSGLERWVKGSVAERVLSSTTMPLLVVHPHQLALSAASITNEQ